MAGGVERMILRVSGLLSDLGHDVHLITWDKSCAKPFYPINPSITWHRLNIGDPSISSIRLKLQRLIKLSKLINFIKPARVISFQAGVHAAVFLSNPLRFLPHQFTIHDM